MKVRKALSQSIMIMNEEKAILDDIHANGGTDTLSTILLDVSEVGYKIISFLPTKDTLGLYSVNQAHRKLISEREDALFEEFIRRDFAEGKILAYVANERHLNYKRLYLAFLHKFSLPKRGVDGERISIPWRCPSQLETRDEDENDYEWPDNQLTDDERPLRPISDNEDVGSLVFIGRVGSDDDPNTCVLLDWEYYGTESTEMGKKLVIDYQRNEIVNENWWYLPCTDEIEDMLAAATTDEGDSWYTDINTKLNESHHMTLHAIDVREYKVISLMDETPFGKYGGAQYEGAMFDMYAHVTGYGEDLPNLYGVPPVGSPYYRNFSDRDFRDGYNELPQGMEVFKVSGGLDLHFMPYVRRGEFATDPEGFDDSTRRFCRTNTGIEIVTSTYGNDGIYFHFQRFNNSAIRICSFLRALIKDKCF